MRAQGMNGHSKSDHLDQILPQWNGANSCQGGEPPHLLLHGLMGATELCPLLIGTLPPHNNCKIHFQEVNRLTFITSVQCLRP